MLCGTKEAATGYGLQNLQTLQRKELGEFIGKDRIKSASARIAAEPMLPTSLVIFLVVLVPETKNQEGSRGGLQREGKRYLV